MIRGVLVGEVPRSRRYSQVNRSHRDNGERGRHDGRRAWAGDGRARASCVRFVTPEDLLDVVYGIGDRYPQTTNRSVTL